MFIWHKFSLCYAFKNYLDYQSYLLCGVRSGDPLNYRYYELHQVVPAAWCGKRVLLYFLFIK